MVIEDEKLDKLIEDCEKKSVEAFKNYQATGHSRYWNTHRKYEDLADTLKVARDAKDRYEQCISIISDLKQWAGTISKNAILFSGTKRT